jgi:hypothetical protein
MIISDSVEGQASCSDERYNEVFNYGTCTSVGKYHDCLAFNTSLHLSYLPSAKITDYGTHY